MARVHPFQTNFTAGELTPKLAGQVDFKKIFSKLTEYGCDVWAVLEWECVIKSPEQGAREGVDFINKHIIESTNKRFDDFAASNASDDELKKILGL